MSEWGSYGLRDLLMFSPQTYYRMLELHNAALWPAQLLALALGVVPLLMFFRPGDRAARGALALLALGWLAVAWWFFWRRYAQINLAAPYFALLFLLEAVLLLAAASRARGPGVAGPSAMRRVSALALYLFAWCLYPLLALLAGRSGRHAEILALAPDPTALATLAVLLRVGGRGFWVLAVIPVLGCLASGATLWAMRAPDHFIAPTLALLAVLVALAEGVWQRHGARKSQ